MLVKPSTEGGLGNPADQRFFSPGRDFLNTRFGSRPAKRPRLSTDSLVANGLRSRMKPMQNGSNTKPETHQDMMQDDGTTSTSGDEGLFIIQVRSPTSKQLLHGQKIRQSREEHADGNNGSVDDPKHEPFSHVNAIREVDAAGLESAPLEMIKEASDAGFEEGAAIKLSEIVNVYVRKRKRSTAADTATVDSAPLQEDGEDVIQHYVRRKHRQIEEPSEHVKVKEDAVQHADTSVHVEEGNLNVFQRRSKMIPIISQAENPDAESGEKLNVFRRRSKVNTETEGNLNVFQRRSKVNTETEGNLNVFQRRSKMISPLSHAENIDRVENINGVEKLHVFHRRSMKNQVPEAEDSHARAENINVFQRRSKMNPVENQPVQAKQHVDVKAKHYDVDVKVKHYDVEGEGNFNVFRRRSKVPEPENIGNFHVFQRRAKMNPERKEDELEKGVSEKLGYVQAEHQPGWLPEGWTLEVREGKNAVKPRDKYYHHDQSGRIFRSKHEVLHFLADGRAGPRSLMSDGSDMNQKTPLVAVADVINSSGDGTQLPNDGSPAKYPSDQENRGKLIFRLKRKQPDSEGGGKGRAKRPMYEVIHGEKASSSTSTPTKLPSQDNNIPPTPQSQVVEKHIPPEKPPDQSARDHSSFPREQEPYTVLGIPATSYSANHTHVFLENTIPSSWHYPVTFSNPGVYVPATAAESGDEGPQVHKALKALKASRAVTKLDHTKLFLDLGRRLCLAGVEHKTRR